MTAITAVSSDQEHTGQREGARSMEMDEFTQKLTEIGKLNSVLKGCLEVLREFAEEPAHQGCTIDTMGGSYFHVRMRSPEGKALCDMFPRKGEEVSCDYQFPTQEDRDRFMELLKTDERLRVKKAASVPKNKGNKGISVYGIDRAGFMKDALELVWNSWHGTNN